MIRLNNEKLNRRQDIILSFFNKGNFGVSKIIGAIEKEGLKVSKVTVVRDLNELLKWGFIERIGEGRAAVYGFSLNYQIVKPVDVENYFKIEVDSRKARENFNFEIFKHLKNIFTEEESNFLEDLNNEYGNNIKNLSPALIKREFERLIIELSWKSSQIEGNTYSLLETEVLIKEHQEAKGHNKEEATMILNHKKALDFIRKNKNEFREISILKIEHLHYLLTKDLGISKNIRKSAVGITGTVYRPLDNQFQIKEALEKVCDTINKEKDFFTKALLISLLIAYIQPFEDGNKRTSRILANAILLAYDVCPLSYRNVDDIEYKKAVILFYEQNNLSYFKRLFADQFEFAVKNYFRR